MTTNEIVTAILSQFPGSSIVRKNKTNFVAIPMGENEDGVMEYASVKVGSLLSKDTKTNAAFNFEAAQAEYAEYMEGVAAKAAEKANKPKIAKSKADPEKQAAMAKRKETALAWLIENPGWHTATEIKAVVDPNNAVTIMQIGSDMKSLLADGSVATEKKEGKNYWAFNG